MLGLEDFGRLEEVSPGHSPEGFTELSENEKDYLREVLPTGDNELIVSRVDELSGTYPPKAIDCNPDVVDVLEPVMDTMENRYLEASDDYIQTEMISDSMTRIEGLDYASWRELSLPEKADVLQAVENLAAEIEHRPAGRIVLKHLGTGDGAENGHFASRCLPEMSREEIVEALMEQPEITINADLMDSSYEGYRDVLDTVIHEGRHIYQECNLYEREVHPSSGDLKNWKINEFGFRYQSYDSTYVGEKLYWMQPLESDARKFAEDVISKFESRYV